MRLGWLTLVTRTVTLPETMRLASVVGSDSGPVMWDGSGLPLGQSKRVGCCAGHREEAKIRGSRNRTGDCISKW